MLCVALRWLLSVVVHTKKGTAMKSQFVLCPDDDLDVGFHDHAPIYSAPKCELSTRVRFLEAWADYLPFAPREADKTMDRLLDELSHAWAD